MNTRIVAFALGLAVLPSCESITPPDPGPSFLRATVQGAVDATYEGNGDFHVGGDRDAGIAIKFSLSSSGKDHANGQSFLLWRHGIGRPATGSYTLQAPNYTSKRWDSFAAVYTRRVGNIHEGYVAQSGEVEITLSTSNRVEGTFRFRGLRYYAREVQGAAPPQGSGRPDVVDPNAPAIEVSGSFVAVPMSQDGGVRR